MDSSDYSEVRSEANKHSGVVKIYTYDGSVQQDVETVAEEIDFCDECGGEVVDDPDRPGHCPWCQEKRDREEGWGHRDVL